MTITASLQRYNNIVANIPSSTSLQATIQAPRGIAANTAAIVTTQSDAPITIKNNAPALSQSYIHNLLDVVEDNPQDGYSLVYNATIDKYEVKPIVLSDVSVDGGTF